MKNIKNFAIYGLSVGSLSNLCAMDDELCKLLVNLTKVLKTGDKVAGLKLLNEHVFDVPDNAEKLSNIGDIYYKFFAKEPKVKGEKVETLFVLFHGLGQSLDNYDDNDIKILHDSFNADVLLIEYNLNGKKTSNTFGDMDGYCKKVANLISGKNYQNNIFFGYSLGSFVGNLVRKYFNDINKEKIGGKEITSKYIGYKGIKDLENAGVSFIKTFINDTNIGISEEEICSCITLVLNPFGTIGFGNGISIDKFSDLFIYLLGEEKYNEIKTLTTNASILNDTKGFDKEKVVFDEKLASKNHNIDLKTDITSILKVFSCEENKDKDVFLFQVNGGDKVVGNGMKDTYNVVIGKKEEGRKPGKKDKEKENKDKEKENKDKKGDDNNKKGDDTLIQPQGGQPQGGQPQGGPGPNIDNNDQKIGSCCDIF